MSEERIVLTGEGCITEYKKGRIYYIRWRLPPLEPGGPRRWSPNRKVEGNKAKARRMLEEYRLELEEELNGDNVAILMADYATRFHERRCAAKNVSLQTLERERYEIDRIVKMFGKKDVTKINVAEILKVYDKLRKNGASQSAINSFHAKLRQVLNQAYKEEIIARNPCNLIDVTEYRRPRAETRRSLTEEQFVQLGKDLLNEEMDGKTVAIWIAMAVGGRRGEILGLNWEDVNFARKNVSFNAQLTAKEGRVKYLKTSKSQRTVALDDSTVVYLRNWKAKQSALFYGGEECPPNAPVCCNEMGGLMSLAAFDRWRRNFFADHGLATFREVKEHYDKNGHKRYIRKGYEGFCLHELRHSQATLLIGENVNPKTVQARGGWSTMEVPMDIYTHSIESKNREAADAIGRYMPQVEPSLASFDLGDEEELAVSVAQGPQAVRPSDSLVEPHKHRRTPIPREEAERKVMECFAQKGDLLTKREISRMTGIDSAKCLSTTLVSLQKKKKLKLIGNTKSSRYKRVS